MKKDKKIRRQTRAKKHAIKKRASEKPSIKTKECIPKTSAAKSSLFKRIQKCIDKKVRPFMQMDGGDIEIIALTPDNVLKVRLHGACCTCPAASCTLQYGVQNALDEEFPDKNIKVSAA